MNTKHRQTSTRITRKKYIFGGLSFILTYRNSYKTGDFLGTLDKILKDKYFLAKGTMDINPPDKLQFVKIKFVYDVYHDMIEVKKSSIPGYTPNKQVDTYFLLAWLARISSTNITFNDTYKDFIQNINNASENVDSNKKQMYTAVVHKMFNHTISSVLDTMLVLEIPDSVSSRKVTPESKPKSNSKSRKSAKAVSATKRRQRAGDCFAHATARSITRTFTLLGLTTEETVNMIYDAIYCVILKYGPGDCQKGGFVLTSVITVLDFFTKDADNDFEHLFKLNYDMIPPICKFGVCKHGRILHFNPEHKSMFVGRLQEIIKRNILEIKVVYEVFSKTGKNKPPQTIYEALLSRYQPIINTTDHAMVLRKWNRHEVECIDSNKSDYTESHVMKVKDIRDICTYNNSYYRCISTNVDYTLDFHWIHINQYDDDMKIIRESIYPSTDITSPSKRNRGMSDIKMFPIPSELKAQISIDSKYANVRMQFNDIIMCGFNYMHRNIMGVLIGYIKVKEREFVGIIHHLIFGELNPTSNNISEYISIHDFTSTSPTVESLKKQLFLYIEPHGADAIMQFVSRTSYQSSEPTLNKYIFMQTLHSVYGVQPDNFQ